LPDITVFDDAFVAANICSGVDVETGHRQNLHELILGAQGVALNAALQGRVAQIEEHNSALRQKEYAIPAAGRGGFNVDAFCALQADPDIDAHITAAERALSAARSAEPVRQQPAFAPLEIPGFDVTAINALLARTLQDLEAEAAERVRAHVESLGRGGEGWINDGMSRVQGVSAGQGHEICPFCGQGLQASSLLRHYRAYFSQAYEGLRAAIVQTGQDVAATHSGESMAGFERSVRLTVQSADFWRPLTEVPALEVDTARITRSWIAARDAVLAPLRAKAAAPLEATRLSDEAIAAIEAYELERAALATVSRSLQACNAAVAVVKERAATANVATLTADLSRLQAIKIRHTEPYVTCCQEYLTEKAAKAATEQLRTQARNDLDNYRQNIFPAYEVAINDYLQRFNAGFRIASVGFVNNRGGSSCNYNLVINNVQV
jgi:wobble nucleotide-excising tRNase